MSKHLTEAEWLGADPQQLLEHLRAAGKFSERKLRLWLCACVWHVAHRLPNDEARKAIEVVEQFADRRIGKQALYDQAWMTLKDSKFIALFRPWEAAETTALLAAATVADVAAATNETQAAAWLKAFNDSWEWGLSPSEAAANANYYMARRMDWFARRDAARNEERVAQAALFRHIVGPSPVREVHFDPAWRTATSVALAEAIYTERELPSGHLNYQRLAVLADCLEEQGCTNEEVLSHLRQQEEAHFRGCWAVDLVLGKS